MLNRVTFIALVLLLTLAVCTDSAHEIGAERKGMILDLIFAAGEGDVQTIEFVKNNGTAVNIEYNVSYEGDISAYTPLMAAALNSHTDAVGLLLNEGANVHTREMFGHTALMFAAKNAGVDVVRKLIAAGATNMYGHTALVFAVARGHIDMAAVLIDAGADVNAVDTFGWPVLLHAVRRGRVDMVKFLLGKGARPLEIN